MKAIKHIEYVFTLSTENKHMTKKNQFIVFNYICNYLYTFLHFSNHYKDYDEEPFIEGKHYLLYAYYL